MKQALRKWGTPLLSAIFVAIFPAIFLYGNNSNEANIQDVLSPMLLFVVIALVLFFICFMIIRNTYKSAIITVLFMLVFENFSVLEKLLLFIFPNLYYWQTTAIFLFILVHLAYFICKFLPKDLESPVSSIFSFILGALIIINIIIAIPGEINKINARELEYETSLNAGTTLDEASTEKYPNIYLLIFDEFAGFHQMEKYYNYDNIVLKDFLAENGFTISYDSHNESIITTTITTNLVNLNYIVDNTTSESEKQVLRQNGELFSLMSGLGYDIRKLTINGLYGEDYKIDGLTSIGTSLTATGEDLNTLLLKQSALYPWIKHTTSDTLQLVEFLESKDNIPADATFTIAHMAISHTPFYYDENGNIRPSSDWNNWRDDSIYLDIYKYNTKLIMSIVENLVKNDPDSLIILMSDHGARASTDIDLFMEKFELNDVNNIFNAFYYKGEDLQEYVNLSAVNTLRRLLNLSIGTDYTLVEVPIDDTKYK